MEQGEEIRSIPMLPITATEFALYARGAKAITVHCDLSIRHGQIFHSHAQQRS
jgi:hypothetical protein